MGPMPKSTFTDPQQIVADLRRELAEYRADRNDALAQQIATGKVRQVVNLSPGELAGLRKRSIARSTEDRTKKPIITVAVFCGSRK